MLLAQMKGVLNSPVRDRGASRGSIDSQSVCLQQVYALSKLDHLSQNKCLLRSSRKDMAIVVDVKLTQAVYLPSYSELYHRIWCFYQLNVSKGISVDLTSVIWITRLFAPLPTIRSALLSKVEIVQFPASMSMCQLQSS